MWKFSFKDSDQRSLNAMSQGIFINNYTDSFKWLLNVSNKIYIKNSSMTSLLNSCFKLAKVKFINKFNDIFLCKSN